MPRYSVPFSWRHRLRACASLIRQQIEVGLPVRTLLFERRGAEARLHPFHRAVGQLPRLLHVVLILVASNGTRAEGPVLNGSIERLDGGRILRGR